MKKVLFILLAGVAVGMLLASENGSETWKKLVDGLDDLKNKAMDEMNGVVDKGKDLIANAGSKAKMVSEKW